MSEEWDFYFSTVEDKPASIFVDLGIRTEAPLSDLNDLVWLRLTMRQPRDDGLSGKDEFSRLSEIEDALQDAISSNERKNAYVGRNTWDGHRDFFFYADNGRQAESTLSLSMVPFPEYEFETGFRSDPKWSCYFEFLYPSKRDHQTIKNGRVLSALENHGDKHEIEREVSHWIYFKSADDRSKFLASAIDQEFKLVDQSEDSEQPRPFGIILSSSSAVDYKTINEVVLMLFDLAEECGGDYDGWETSVERGAESC